MVEAGGDAVAEAEEVRGRLVVLAVRVVDLLMREAERHVGGAGAVEVGGGGGGRQARALLGQRVAEGPVGDEAVPPA